MRAKLLLMPLGVALLCLTACDIEDFGSFQRYQRDFHYSYPLKHGGSFSVEGFNGSVEISGWDQDSVDISGTKYGPTQEAEDSLPSAPGTADRWPVRCSVPTPCAGLLVAPPHSRTPVPPHPRSACCRAPCSAAVLPSPPSRRSPGNESDTVP